MFCELNRKITLENKYLNYVILYLQQTVYLHGTLSV